MAQGNRGGYISGNHTATTQQEQFRRQRHQQQGGTHVAGTYHGFDRDTNYHFFSADSTGGGSTDSIMIPHHNSPGSGFIGEKGKRYLFEPDGNTSSVRPYYGKEDFGVPGAPMSDTPNNFR